MKIKITGVPCLSQRIRTVYSLILRFPVSHYISDWRPANRTLHLVTFILTDSGVIGLGEGVPYWSSIIEDYVKVLNLAKVLIGLSLEDALSTLRSVEYEEFERKSRVNYGAYMALESALLNALYRSKGVRYEAEVLGGVNRTKIPITYTIFLNHPKTMAHKLSEAIRSGFEHVKIKIPCNLEELEKLLEVLYSIRGRSEAGNIILRADANECFSTFEKAKKALSIMEKYNINIVEQPMPRDRLEDIARLRKEFYPVIEIMVDESLRKPSDIELFTQMEIADIINFHPSKLGCLTITREAILKTQKLGMKANIGSALMTEIGLIHYLNLAASIPRLDYPLEEPGLYNIYGYGIMQEPPEIINGSIALCNINISDLNFNMIKKFTANSLFKEQLLMLARKLYEHVQ